MYMYIYMYRERERCTGGTVSLYPKTLLNDKGGSTPCVVVAVAGLELGGVNPPSTSVGKMSMKMHVLLN